MFSFKSWKSCEKIHWLTFRIDSWWYWRALDVESTFYNELIKSSVLPRIIEIEYMSSCLVLVILQRQHGCPITMWFKHLSHSRGVIPASPIWKAAKWQSTLSIGLKYLLTPIGPPSQFRMQNLLKCKIIWTSFLTSWMSLNCQMHSSVKYYR